MTELIGWLGSILFAACAVPQAIMSYREGNSRGISLLFLLMWFFGEVFTFYYVIVTQGLNQVPLLANYIFNFILLIVIIRYKLYPRL